LHPDRVAHFEGEAARHQVDLLPGGEPRRGSLGDDQLIGVLVAFPACSHEQGQRHEEETHTLHGAESRTSASTTTSPAFSNVSASSIVEPASSGETRSRSMTW